MTKNIGQIDKVARLLLGAALIVAAFTLELGPSVKVILVVAGLIALGTALINICPLYGVFGINTCKTKS